MQKLADISMFEGLQTHANEQMGYTANGKPMTQMSVFNNGAIDNAAVHVGEVRPEDINLLKQIMRDVSAIELETINFGHLANEIRKRVESKSQLDRIFEEPRLMAMVQEEFNKLKERYMAEKQKGKEQLGLDTFSKDVPFFDD